MQPDNLHIVDNLKKSSIESPKALGKPRLVYSPLLEDDAIIGVPSWAPKAASHLAPLMSASVKAGFPSPAEQYVETPLDLNSLLVQHPAATFYLRASGDSMIDAGINPGDILVVDRSLEATNNSIVIAAVDNEFTVKYLHISHNSISLVAANKKYEPLVFSGDTEVRIFGVVTAVIHQLGKAR